MYVESPLWILLLVSVMQVSQQEEMYDEYDTYEDAQPLNCATTESIRGGNVSYSQGGLEGSVLTYDCGPGKHPFPVGHRRCGADGEWSPMRLNNGRPASRATCKDMLCPAQLQLDHGDFWPRDQWMAVGSTQSFSCLEGFTLHGSAERNCTATGEWTGTTPVCDNHADDCSDPGIPPGAQRWAGRFRAGEKATYRCQAGLDLLGSAERVCLENREWSGASPRCQGPNTFDSPGAVAEAMAGSLAGVMDLISHSEKKTQQHAFARTINVAHGSRINVYILLDTSGSIQKQEFEVSRDATVALIRKLDSYEVQLRFHVVSFASEAQDIVDIAEADISSSAEDVVWNLMQFDYHSHGRKTGTNLYSALLRVSEKISFFRQNAARNQFNETQNVIIIETDGNSNTGKNPQIALAQIRHLLGYSPTSKYHEDETLLDVYVFGVGAEVKKEKLNALASKKTGEDHVFVLKDYKALGEVFNRMISDKSVTMCGVAQEDVAKEDEEPVHSQPWHVTLKAPEWGKNKWCSGSIVSPNWVLTAAHCFAKAATDQFLQKVDLTHGGGSAQSSFVVLHPKYNTKALRERNVSQFFDYDVALVHVNESIPLSWKARPICLPCTVPAERAMKKINSTCQQHRQELLPHKETLVFFMQEREGKPPKRKETHAHTQSGRPGCVENARQTLTEPTDVTLEEYVPDRFLCTGGSVGFRDAFTCKGDSGGSLFLQKRKRYFQLGVVSWGTRDVCSSPGAGFGDGDEAPPPDARDFHIDVFAIMPWLKHHLGRQIRFLREVI